MHCLLDLHGSMQLSTGKSNDPSPSTGQPSYPISCCAFNANGTVFVSGGSDTYARVHLNVNILNVLLCEGIYNVWLGRI